MPAVRATSWHHSSLAVSDLDTAIAFYRDAFGYEVAFEERDMSDQIANMAGVEGLTCDLAQLRSALGDHVLELIAFRRSEHGMPPIETAPLRPGAAHIAFAVEDIESALDAVEALGAVRIGGITEFDEGRSVYCREPAGSFFEMEEFRDGPVPDAEDAESAGPEAPKS